MAIELKAYSNCSNVFLVWRVAAVIPSCCGFAIYRRPASDTQDEGEPLPSWVGFSNAPISPGEHELSSDWPFQRFNWTDFTAQTDAPLQYRVVPMLGTPVSLHPDKANASAWTDVVEESRDEAAAVNAYFNPGVLAAQWVARQMEAAHESLENAIRTPGDALRERLGGALLPVMRDLLTKKLEPDDQVYLALFELNDPDLLALLKGLGARAHLILTNGAPERPPSSQTQGASDAAAIASGDPRRFTDENYATRDDLKEHSGVEVIDRLLPPGHLGHNKFLIVCGSDGQAKSVWTGSTNWTETGLCTQANNGLLINDPGLAKIYKDQWDRIKGAGSSQPDWLVQENSTVKSASIAGRTVTVWFTPTSDQQDMQFARGLIEKAKQGFLFLNFIPGWQGSLIQDIQRVAQANGALYTRGVVNQDPGTTKNPAVGLFHQGEAVPANFDVLIPAKIDAAFSYWIPEILKLARAHAIVHSKVIVIDPFGDHPVVMTGSHNMGPRASMSNDDNLIVIENDPVLAAAYAVNIIAIFNQYWWRFNTMNQAQRVAPPVGGSPTPLSARTPAVWTGLRGDDTWQRSWLQPPRSQELAFWLGSPPP